MSERRLFERYAVNLPCRVEFKGGTLSAIVLDLSRGGARIKFPLAGSKDGLWSVTFVQIDGIGHMAAQTRWQSGEMLGLVFLTSLDRVQKYLDFHTPRPF